MRLGISECERGAPGAANDDPALKGKLLADHLHIRDQVHQCVLLPACFRTAAPRAALIKQHRMKALGIEQAAVIALATAAGSAMQVNGGNAVIAADALDIDFVTIADRKQLRGQRRKWVAALCQTHTSGVDLTFAICLHASSQSECQIVNSTSIYCLLVVL